MSGRHRAFVLGIAVVAMTGVVCPGTRARNPELDISQYAHTTWKIRDGFTKGMIFAIAQTPDGYLWLGTEFGLYRFDGVRAVPWQPPAGQQLPDNRIHSLLLARDGTLWIGTLKGLVSWKDGKLTRYPELGQTIVNSILENRDGTIWVGAYEPGRLCAIQGARVQCYGEGSFGVGVWGLYEDRKLNLWVTSATGLWRWDSVRPEHYTFPGAVGNSVIEGEGGELLVETGNGLKQIIGGRIQSYELPGVNGQFRATGFFRSSDGSLWIAATQGLLHVHQGRTDTFGAADGLSGDPVGRIFEDHEGNVWVSTMNGLDRFREYAIPTISRNQGLSTSMAWAVQAMPDGAVWISTANGMNRWHNGSVTVYGRQVAPGRVAGEVVQHSGGGLTSTPRSLGLDDQGRLWVATQDGSFFFDGGRFIPVHSAPGDNIWTITSDGHGKMWVNNGTAGLFYFTPGEAAKPIPWTRFGQKGFGAQAVLPDRSNGGVWLGFWDGGIAYFKDGEVRASYTVADGLGTGRVAGLRFGSRGTLWAATEGGLSRIRDGRILTLTSKNGLPCDTVHWSIEDDDQFVWVYMACGLMRIARSELDAWVADTNRNVEGTVFDVSDGVRTLSAYGGYSPHVSKAADGKIWFVTGEGVTVIDPRHLPVNKLPPPVQIEQVTADRKTYNAASVANGQLPALLRDLEIDYTALSLVVPEKVRFRYKLEGWDRDWQDAGNRRQAFYTGLAPRHYRFRVLACNNSGVWNETGASLDFSIAPAYYQTSWFLFVSAAGVLGLLWAAFQFRLRQVTERVRHRMEGRLEERERIARDLHDTLLQSVQGLILKFHAVSRQCDETVRQTIEKTLDHADEVMAEGRDRVRNLRATSVSLADLPAAFRRVADETAPGREALFKVVVEGKARELNPMILEESFSIGREALSNALIHSGGQNVEVEITYDARQFRLRINDDGRGVDPEVLEKGGRAGHWGLPGMRERARKMGAQLEFWSRPGTGTEIELKIPGATAYGAGRIASKGFWLGRAFDRLRGRYE